MKKIKLNSKICGGKGNQVGRSMIEMLGVLAIMAVITVLSIMAYTMAMKTVKINETKNQLGVINTQLNALFQDKNSDGRIPTPTDTASRKVQFEKYFVDTGLLKENKAPVGGFYSLIFKIGSVDLDLHFNTIKECKTAYPSLSNLTGFSNIYDGCTTTDLRIIFIPESIG